MGDRLEQFGQAVLSMQALALGAFGGGMPGVPVGAEGDATTVASVMAKLKKNTATFCRLYKAADRVQLEVLAHDIEGGILTLQTLAVILDKEASGLIDTLYDLVEAKE